MKGLLIAILIIITWAGHLTWSLFLVDPDFTSPFLYLHTLIQAYLFTGLFITGHDAMHGSVNQNRKLNNLIGWVSTLLFAFLSFSRLRKNHYLHHLYPASEKDPDFYKRSNNPFVWWGVFIVRYVTWWQLLLMALTYNLLMLKFSESKILFFWVIPAILGTFQLFFFGTYIPHRLPHTGGMGPHRARTLRKNHLLAMAGCYFFGYHREHHESPVTPWWKLYSMK